MKRALLRRGKNSGGGQVNEENVFVGKIGGGVGDMRDRLHRLLMTSPSFLWLDLDSIMTIRASVEVPYKLSTLQKLYRKY